MHFKTWIALIFSFGIAGCVSVRTIPKGDWSEIIEKNKIKGSTLFISDIGMKAKIVSVTADSVIFEQEGQKSSLPREAVSRVVVPYKGSKAKAELIGAASGFAVGALAGSLFKTHKSKNSTDTLANSASGTPVLVGALLGSVAGMLTATLFTKDDSYEMNAPLKIVRLHPGLGDEITPADLAAFKLFDDLAVEPEKLLRVEVLQMSGGNYFLSYDLALGIKVIQRWKIVDEVYINQQKKKLKI